jgi:hypothetical protein
MFPFRNGDKGLFDAEGEPREDADTAIVAFGPPTLNFFFQSGTWSAVGANSKSMTVQRSMLAPDERKV